MVTVAQTGSFASTSFSISSDAPFHPEGDPVEIMMAERPGLSSRGPGDALVRRAGYQHSQMMLTEIDISERGSQPWWPEASCRSALKIKSPLI